MGLGLGNAICIMEKRSAEALLLAGREPRPATMIDYVFMSSRYRSSVEVACVKWGATMYRHELKYHGLVEIKFCAWLHRPPTPKPRRDMFGLASLDRGGDEVSSTA